MSDIIIACENLKDEIEYICKNLDIYPDIVYIQSQLHNNPKMLNEKLQSEIDKYVDVENIILLYGLCGTGVVGLKSENANIIIPKVDDCISLYLGGIEKRSKLYKSSATYFFTKRYIENEASIYNEVQFMKNKYGFKKTRKIYKELFSKYEYIRSIDTGTYNEEDIVDKIDEMCEIFHLKYESVKGDLEILNNILNKKYQNNIIVIPKQQEIKLTDFGM